ncbi:MAG TPA: hypothetical protein VM901_07615 [Bdellovibrionota bacterium]|jgi:hypothetical protein|nr:hypothetical protein [Bdellovibrionota bacterium]
MGAQRYYRAAFWTLAVACSIPPAALGAPEKHAWAKNCAVILGMAAAVGGSIESRQRAIANGDFVFKENLVLEGASHLIGPVSLPMRLLGRSSHGETMGEALKHTVLYDYAYLLGYASLYAGLVRFNRKFGEIRFDDFEKASLAAMGPPPARVLVIDSFSEQDPLKGFPEFYRYQRYAQPGQAELKFVTNLDMLTYTLARLEQQIKNGEIKPFDRVEVYMHGHPNRLSFADGTAANTDQIKAALAGRHFDITTAGADLRFVSCSLAGGCPFKSGAQDLIQEMGRAILPRGGTVLGAPRNIIVAEGLWSWENFQGPGPTPWEREASDRRAYLAGVKAFLELYNFALTKSWRNYKESLQDVIAIEIPPTPGIKP